MGLHQWPSFRRWKFIISQWLMVFSTDSIQNEPWRRNRPKPTTLVSASGIWPNWRCCLLRCNNCIFGGLSFLWGLKNLHLHFFLRLICSEKNWGWGLNSRTFSVFSSGLNWSLNFLVWGVLSCIWALNLFFLSSVLCYCMLEITRLSSWLQILLKKNQFLYCSICLWDFSWLLLWV